MKLIGPDYYGDFRCIADACRHCCCVGWEIDIDKETLAKYQSMQGAMGERIRAHMAQEEDTAHFLLTKEERCPFLNAQGLCELILECGEDMLCQICTDHPRFRNFYTDRTEIGLGLCCEAACRLIMTQQAPTQLIVLKDDGENEMPDEEETAFLNWRDALIGLAQERSFPIQQRMEHVLAYCGCALPEYSKAEWADFYLSLERLDEGWTYRLEQLRRQNKTPLPATPEWECALEQLAVYFLYRHLPSALTDGDYAGYVMLAVLSFRMICDVCSAEEKPSIETLCDTARMYSAEIEYSQQNIDAILEMLGGNAQV